MAAMKNNAIVCNIGHFDNEIQTSPAGEVPSGKRSSPRSTTSSSPTASASSCWPRAAGEPGLRHRPPQLRDESSFANQTIAQIELFTHSDYAYEQGKVYVLPKHLDEAEGPVAEGHVRRSSSA